METGKSIPSDSKINCDNFKHELAGTYTEAGCVDLDAADSVVKRYSNKLIPLEKPKSYFLRVCGQDGTVYAGNEEQLEAWKDFYLEERKEMVVIGAIDDFPCDAFGLQLVLLLCEDGNIYAYEDEVLHLVARHVNKLFDDGLTFPGLECYNLGQFVKDCTEEEYEEIMESDEIKKIKKEHSDFRASLACELLESIREFNSIQIKNVEEDMDQPEKNSHTGKQWREIIPQTLLTIKY